MSDVLEDEIERAVDERSIPVSTPQRTRTSIPFLGEPPFPVWTGGILAPVMPTGSDTFTSLFQGQLLTIMVSRPVLGHHTVQSEFDDHVVCTPYQRVLRQT